MTLSERLIRVCLGADAPSEAELTMSLRQLMGGRFTLLRPLGRGAMGSVWMGEQAATGRAVAIKVMTYELLRSEPALARFRKEARTAAQLRSRHIVQIIDYDVDPTMGPFIAMELLEGESLEGRLRSARRLAPTQVARIVRQTARALAHAHRAGVVHRDIKPANIFLQSEEHGPELVKVLDFGLAKAPLTAGIPGTQSGCVIGTLSHMSPEQARGELVDHRADLWSLGMVAFQCMTGSLPFHCQDPAEQVWAICRDPIPAPSSLWHEVPQGFDDWMSRALQRDPLKRFQEANEMAAALDALCTSSPVSEPMPEQQEDHELFVMDNGNTVGPVTASLLQQGIRTGRVGTSALVWRNGWREWIRADELDGELIAALDRHAGAEWPMQESAARTGATLQAGSADPAQVEMAQQAQYYIMDGNATVGPVRTSQLLWGARAQRVPRGTLVWKEGWSRWKSLAEVFPHLWDS